ncbi:MAG TPA: ABC transporter ATP-binding protein [Holophaga sp.]|nr:ABC transporter ATP-binding protein [Holophaga sp.]HPS66885.1 ABC transporter ATP-binding protein [Holophaga sp.]
MLLEVENLSVTYGDIAAVRSLSFVLDQGELVSIVGANGAGKTSILNAVMGIEPIRGGKIRFDGADITHLPVHERARRGIRVVPERSRVFPRLSVYENILTGVYGLRKKVDVPARLKWLYEIFPRLEERHDQLASTLSGGEQQQLAIARALVSEPRLLLVDEVSMGLMPKLVDQVFELLRKLNKELGLTILLVEQNAMASLKISDRGYVMEVGTCAYEGAAADLIEHPKVVEAYLG